MVRDAPGAILVSMVAGPFDRVLSITSPNISSSPASKPRRGQAISELAPSEP
jgi:hypothetical protein